MPLEVHPATASDFDLAATIYGPSTGDFSSPICRLSWPLSPTSPLDAHRRRTEWSCTQQKACMLHDPSVRMMKVIDTSLPTSDPQALLALARWSRFETGYRELGDLAVCGEKDRNDPATWPPEMNVELFCKCMDTLYEARRGWMGEGKYWVLTTVVTREGARKRGAGGMLVQWGVNRAREEGVPAFLEATEANAKWYEGFGFRAVGSLKAEVEGVKIEMCRMRIDPK